MSAIQGYSLSRFVDTYLALFAPGNEVTHTWKYSVPHACTNTPTHTHMQVHTHTHTHTRSTHTHTQYTHTEHICTKHTCVGLQENSTVRGYATANHWFLILWFCCVVLCWWGLARPKQYWKDSYRCVYILELCPYSNSFTCCYGSIHDILVIQGRQVCAVIRCFMCTLLS